MTDFPAVLYVEDDEPSRDIMCLMLTEVMQLSHLTIFEDSSDFLTRASQIYPKPDVVLLDIHVQPHSGFAMLEMLRNHPRFQQTPVVALTASVMNEEVQQLKQAGFNGVIAKPIDMEAFPGMLARILEGEALWYVTQ